MAVAGAKLVVLRALGLGDLLTVLPALRGLATAFPDHRRLLVAPGSLTGLVDLSGVGFDVVDADLRGVTGAFPRLPRPVHGADLAVNLHGRGPQSTRVLRATNPRRLLAFDEPGLAEWKPDEHEVRRWCRLLDSAGIPADPADLALRAPPADLGQGPPVTLLHPGAASPARRWPVERWAAVARSEMVAGARVVVTGGPEEAPLAGEVAAAAGVGDCAVLAGRTTLSELAGVVAAASRVVCGDTGVAHLATAVGTPSVVLFGPTSPAQWGPPAGQTRHQVLWTGRRGDPHGSRPHPGLLEITVDDVLTALHRLPVRR